MRRGVLMAGLDDAANDAYTLAGEERRRFDAAWRQAAERLLLYTAESAPRFAIAERLLEVDAFDEDALARRALQADLAPRRAAQAQRYDAFAGNDGSARRRTFARAARRCSPRRPRWRGGRRRPLPNRGPLRPLRPLRPLHLSCRRGSFTHPRGVHRPRQQLAEIRLMLARADCRLLTLVGPGGSGKSSLARRVAAGRSALWIELQDLPTAAAALGRLAQQLGFDLDERRDAVGVLVHLAAEPPLVVLDNAEHLEGLAANVERLLHGHRTLKVLVTSRERLHLPDEWLLPLAGLALPDEDSRDFDAAASFDAVRLFDARSRAAQRGFELRRHYRRCWRCSMRST
ncbi:MAG: ATP-binding protein [Rubrivivax sp.]